jgi:hypothetical protein
MTRFSQDVGLPVPFRISPEPPVGISPEPPEDIYTGNIYLVCLNA